MDSKQCLGYWQGLIDQQGQDYQQGLDHRRGMDSEQSTGMDPHQGMNPHQAMDHPPGPPPQRCLPASQQYPDSSGCMLYAPAPAVQQPADGLGRDHCFAMSDMQMALLCWLDSSQICHLVAYMHMYTTRHRLCQDCGFLHKLQHCRAAFLNVAVKQRTVVMVLGMTVV